MMLWCLHSVLSGLLKGSGPFCPVSVKELLSSWECDSCILYCHTCHTCAPLPLFATASQPAPATVIHGLEVRSLDSPSPAWKLRLCSWDTCTYKRWVQTLAFLETGLVKMFCLFVYFCPIRPETKTKQTKQNRILEVQCFNSKEGGFKGETLDAVTDSWE